jgi:CheY-like chemotaxis protein
VFKLVEGMAEMMRSSIGPAIQITTDIPADISPIRVDRNQLELALLNLALNGRDAMPFGGDLAIAARRGDAGSGGPDGLPARHYICLSVTDVGTGMDEATLKRATEPFFTTKGVGKGSGLGLSMVHGLAAQSDGAMCIKSRVGEGTTVELWLPAVEQAGSGPAMAAPALAGAVPACRVLLVDDDALITASTAAILEDLGHQVIEASSGANALDILRSGARIDLVITDHAMPGMTGTELARQVRQAWPHLPVILASGYADLPGREETWLPRLAKPYRSNDLATHIAKLVVQEPTSRVVQIDSFEGSEIGAGRPGSLCHQTR